VEANPEQYREKAAVKLTGPKYWTMPVLAQRRLYVRDQSEIICWDLARK
jgi:hypothetical protein